MRSDTADVRLSTGWKAIRKQQTRAEIIAAGRRLLSEKGLYESRIEDVTELAGVAKGTLYTYFSDKDELIRAVVVEGFTALTECIEKQVHGARSLAAVCELIAGAHLVFFAQNPDLRRIFHQARGMLKFDRPDWRPLRIARDAYFGAVAGILGQCPRVKPLSPEQRLELAMILFGAVSGVMSVRESVEPKLADSPASGELVDAISGMMSAYVLSCRRSSGAT